MSSIRSTGIAMLASPMKPFTLAFVLVHFCYTPVHAHDWYTGRIDPELRTKCCTGNECHEVSDESVTKLANGDYFYTPNKWTVPAERVQISPDSNFHICETAIVTYPPDAIGYDLLCFFAPLGTM